MVEAAHAESKRLGFANVEHRVLDAERMDLPAKSADGVLCRWGYTALPDPARRSGRRGECCAKAVAWRSRYGLRPSATPWAAFRGGCWWSNVADPRRIRRRLNFAMANPERTRGLLADAGFDVLRLEEVELTYGFEDFGAYWAYLNELAGALALAIDAFSESDRRTFRERLEHSLEAYRSDGGYAMPGLVQNTLAA